MAHRCADRCAGRGSNRCSGARIAGLLPITAPTTAPAAAPIPAPRFAFWFLSSGLLLAQDITISVAVRSTETLRIMGTSWDRQLSVVSCRLSSNHFAN